eukprot:g7684.t1
MKRWFLKFAAYVYRHPEGCHQKLMSALLGDNLPFKRRAERWTTAFETKQHLAQFFSYFSDDDVLGGDLLASMEKQVAAAVGGKDLPGAAEVVPRWAPLDPEKTWGHAFHFDDEIGAGTSQDTSLIAFHFEAGGWVENQETVKKNDEFREQLFSDGGRREEEGAGGYRGESEVERVDNHEFEKVPSGGEFGFFYGDSGPPSDAAVRAFLRSRRLGALPKKLKVCNQSGRFTYREDHDAAEVDEKKADAAAGAGADVVEKGGGNAASSSAGGTSASSSRIVDIDRQQNIDRQQRPGSDPTNTTMSQAEMARATFELENNVLPNIDADWVFEDAQAERLYRQAPWKQDVHFFKEVRVSAVALLKMVTHARSGGDIEIMGLMQGKATTDGKFIVLDAFPLPVEGTETRVSAGAVANEFMCMFKDLSEKAGKKESLMGWYHSHPGYRPWLSGIDVSTQRLYQAHQEPWLAVVIDPIRTCSAGKVDIGAFRTYPEGYSAAQSGAGGATGLSSGSGSASSARLAGEEKYDKKKLQVGNLPLGKIEDFGVYANEYYPLKTSFFKSAQDAQLLSDLWEKYWVETLSSSPLLNNEEQTAGSVKEIASKLSMCPCCRPPAFLGGSSSGVGAGSQSANRQDPGAAIRVGGGGGEADAVPGAGGALERSGKGTDLKIDCCGRFSICFSTRSGAGF